MIDKPSVSVVIPIRAEKTTQRELVRLDRLLQTIPEEFEIVIVDDGSSQVVKNALSERYCVSRGVRSRLRYCRLNTARRRFSLARARNHGAKNASAPVVIFHDVDFLGTQDVYVRILDHIRLVDLASKPENFFCVPVAFLNEQGNAHFMAAFEAGREAWSFTHRGQLPLGMMDFLVQGSSCIVTNRKDLLQMGGHDRRFHGHGAEDFELLHRLGARFPIAPLPPEYSRNMGSGNITQYRGFRAYFSLYGEEARQSGCTLVHLWHPKREDKKYYRHKQNFKRLQKTLKSRNHRRGWRRWGCFLGGLTTTRRSQIDLAFIEEIDCE